MTGPSVPERGLPTAACPATKRMVVLPARIWAMKQPTRVNCPVCGAVHIWDPAGGRLTAPVEGGRAAGRAPACG